MNLDLPICSTDYWPPDIIRCTEKFEVYIKKYEMILKERNQTAETPKINTWKFNEKSESLSSGCLIWDIIHVCHYMAVLNWNEGLKNLEEKRYLQSKGNFKKAYDLFEKISSEYLPNWNPVCMNVFENKCNIWVYRENPVYLTGNIWNHLKVMSNAYYYRTYVEHGLNETNTIKEDEDEDRKKWINTNKLLSRISKRGYLIMSSHGNVFMRSIKNQFECLLRDMRIITLMCWIRSTEENISEEYGIGIKILSDIISSGNTPKILGDLRSDLKLREKRNESIFFQKIPSEDLSESILNTIEYKSLDMTNKS